MIQGGDPNTRDLTGEEVAKGGRPGAPRPGTGGPGYCIKAEYRTNPNNKHDDAALAMARSQMPDSAGSQFYFCLGRSTASTATTRSLAPRSRARTSSASCARATSLSA